MLILFDLSGWHLGFVCWLVGCSTSQQHASVSQGRIWSDNFTCCHTEIEVADPTFHLTQSQYTDTAPTSASTDPIMPGAWLGSHWSATVYDSTPKKSRRKRDSYPRSSALEADALTTRSTRRSDRWGTTIDFTTSFLHSSRFSAFRSCIIHSRPVHSLLLSSPRFLCLPPPRWPSG